LAVAEAGKNAAGRGEPGDRGDRADAALIDAAQRLDRLRTSRVRPARDTSINGAVSAQRERTGRLMRQAGSAAAVWAELAPAGLRERSRVEKLVRGSLHVVVTDAATRFTLDRWLRGGGQERVAAAARAPIDKVRVRIGSLDDEQDRRARGR